MTAPLYDNIYNICKYMQIYIYTYIYLPYLTVRWHYDISPFPLPFFPKINSLAFFTNQQQPAGLQLLKSHSCWVSGRQQQLCLGTSPFIEISLVSAKLADLRPQTPRSHVPQRSVEEASPCGRWEKQNVMKQSTIT